MKARFRKIFCTDLDQYLVVRIISCIILAFFFSVMMFACTAAMGIPGDLLFFGTSIGAGQIWNLASWSVDWRRHYRLSSREVVTLWLRGSFSLPFRAYWRRVAGIGIAIVLISIGSKMMAILWACFLAANVVLAAAFFRPLAKSRPLAPPYDDSGSDDGPGQSGRPSRLIPVAPAGAGTARRNMHGEQRPWTRWMGF